MITSTKASIVQRHKDYNLYNPERLVNTPDNLNYKIGHCLEELAEFAINPSAEEAADVILFLQDVVIILLPNYSLNIKLESRGYYIPLPQVIMKLRSLIAGRKDWKTYPKVTPGKISRVGALTVQHLLWFVKPEDLLAAYNTKVEFNKTRNDWHND